MWPTVCARGVGFAGRRLAIRQQAGVGAAQELVNQRRSAFLVYLSLPAACNAKLNLVQCFQLWLTTCRPAAPRTSCIPLPAHSLRGGKDPPDVFMS